MPAAYSPSQSVDQSVCARGAPFLWRSPNRALWASPSPHVGLQLVDLRGDPRPVAGLRLGGRTCPRQSQLASQLLNFLSKILRSPLRQNPCVSIYSAHLNPHSLRGPTWFACRVVLVSSQLTTHSQRASILNLAHSSSRPDNWREISKRQKEHWKRQGGKARLES